MSDQPFGSGPMPTPPPPGSVPWQSAPPPPPPSPPPHAGYTPGYNQPYGVTPAFQQAPATMVMPSAPADRRIDRAIGFGLVAALVAGILWYGIVVISDRQFVYLAIGFGVLIGLAVVVGAGRAGLSTTLIAMVIAAIGIVASYYFINRHAIVEALSDEGGYEPIPLFGSLEQMKEIVRFGYEEEPTQILFSVIAVVAAGYMGSRNHH